MGAKDWLMRAWYLDKEINLLLKEQRLAFEKATSATAKPKDVCVKSSGARATASEIYAEYSIQVDQITDERVKIKKEITNIIRKVDDVQLRILLFARYVRCMKWDDVADTLGRDKDHVTKRLHPKALKKIEEILNAP